MEVEHGCPFEAPLRAMLCKACCESSRNAVPPCVRAWLMALTAPAQVSEEKEARRRLPTAA